jgi:iron complex outermembrane receptor protein
MGLSKKYFAAALTAAAGVMLTEQIPAIAQEETTVLPDIHVTQTRLTGRAPGQRGSGTGTPVVGETGPSAEGDASATAIINQNIISGSSTSVITARDIANSPSQTLPDILAQQAGIQVQQLLGGVNGSRSSVDLRGFGAFAHSNVLILVNGRRYQDFDLQGFDFSSIPVNGIERIEITRGNSGGVLYGDGAIGGVINIVTKRGPSPAGGRVEAAVGSFNYHEGRFSANNSWGPWSASVYSNAIESDGYRRNSRLNQQNVVGELNYTGIGWSSFLNIAADNQRQGLSGGLYNRPAAGVPFTLATPRESNTPLDNAEKQGVNITSGFVATIAQGVDLIVDGGLRRKFQKGTFYNYYSPVFPSNTTLRRRHRQTSSIP